MKKTQTARLDPYKVLANGNLAVESWVTADDRLENLANALSTDSSVGFNLFRALIDNISDFIYVKDSECRYVNCNQVTPPMNGFSSPLELMGKTDYDLYPMELANRYYADEQKILKTGKPIVNQEEPYIDAKGNIKWVSVSKIPIPDKEGNYIGIVGINRDITEYKLSMEKINDQATLLDETPDAIIVRNMDDDILFWNKSAERLYGYSENEALNKKSYELLYSEEHTKLAAIEQSVVSNGEWSGEVIQKTKENKQVTVHSRQTLVQDKLGFPKSILVNNTDITEKKHHDYQMLRAQRMEGIGTLASGIAHDLNNLLAPIILATDLLLTNPSQEKSIDFLKTIKKSANHAGTVVNQVLTFSRGVESGECILFHPKHIAKEIIQITKETFPKNINIHFNIPNDLWPIEGDPTQLHQVLLNICINARDSMPDGGEIHLKAEKEYLDQSYVAVYPETKAGNYVIFDITDTGYGMTKDTMKYIFDPFYTTKKEGHGTGLGLSISHGIIKKHGGFIAAESKVGYGSTIKVFLPAVTNDVVNSLDSEKVNIPKAQGELILVVDDEPAICDMVVHVLEGQGYNVMTAKDGTEALAIFIKHQKQIRMVLTDIVMPHMDGLRLARTLKRVKPELNIIASTGQDQEKEKDELNNIGINVILEKPYSSESLQVIVHEALNGKAYAR